MSAFIKTKIVIARTVWEKLYFSVTQQNFMSTIQGLFTRGGHKFMMEEQSQQVLTRLG